jgi:hypothetical protein
MGQREQMTLGRLRASQPPADWRRSKLQTLVYAVLGLSQVLSRLAFVTEAIGS